MTISVEKLKKLRTNNGWSQERLSEISGVSLRTIQRIEGGHASSLETQLALANAFDISPGDLVAVTDVVIGDGGINWSGIGGLVLCALLMYLQFYLSGVPFFEYVSVILVLGLALGMAAISLGMQQAAITLALLRWVFVLPKQESGLQKHLPNLNRIIYYCYAAGAISSLVGIIAVMMTPENIVYHRQYEPLNQVSMGLGIALLTLLYGAMLAELVFRPLKHQLERLLIGHNGLNTEVSEP
jgi:transcriptional regulator with XRE-family HTH domain